MADDILGMLMRGEIPMPRPDPRGPVVAQDWRNIGPDGKEIAPTPSMPPAPPSYGMSDHVLAALRALFEGEKFREYQTRHGARDATGLYDVKRQ